MSECTGTPLSRSLNLRMSDLFSEADSTSDAPITARHSIGRLADAVRVNTTNYEYFHICAHDAA
jgi:hypothetical protein